MIACLPTKLISIQMDYKFFGNGSEASASHKKKLSRCWNSATSFIHSFMGTWNQRQNNQTAAVLLPPKCKTPHFFHTRRLDYLGRIRDHEEPRRLWHAGSRDTDLSCYQPISTLCCTVWSQSNNVADRQTDRRHARSIIVTRGLWHKHVTLKNRDNDCSSFIVGLRHRGLWQGAEAANCMAQLLTFLRRYSNFSEQCTEMPWRYTRHSATMLDSIFPQISGQNFMHRC